MTEMPCPASCLTCVLVKTTDPAVLRAAVAEQMGPVGQYPCGHPRTTANTYTQPGTTWRSCRACNNGHGPRGGKMTLRTDETAFASRIRALRLAQGWTVSSVALRLDVNPTTIALLEGGRRNPSAVMLERLADLHQLTMDDLWRSR